MPSKWEERVMVPIHRQKFFTKDCTYCERELDDYQVGFRGGRSTVDQIFTLRQILEKYWEYNKDSWYIFIDFNQAYESIH